MATRAQCCHLSAESSGPSSADSRVGDHMDPSSPIAELSPLDASSEDSRAESYCLITRVGDDVDVESSGRFISRQQS